MKGRRSLQLSPVRCKTLITQPSGTAASHWKQRQVRLQMNALQSWLASVLNSEDFRPKCASCASRLVIMPAAYPRSISPWADGSRNDILSGSFRRPLHVDTGAILSRSDASERERRAERRAELVSWSPRSSVPSWSPAPPQLASSPPRRAGPVRDPPLVQIGEHCLPPSRSPPRGRRERRPARRAHQARRGHRHRRRYRLTMGASESPTGRHPLRPLGESARPAHRRALASLRSEVSRVQRYQLPNALDREAGMVGDRPDHHALPDRT